MKTRPISNHKAKRTLQLKGWSNRKAAPALGVDVSHLSKVLNGHRESKSLLARIKALPTREAAETP